MSKTPQIRKGILRPMIDELDAGGVTLEPILQRAGVALDDLRSPDDEMEEWRAYELLHLGARRLSDSVFGLRAGLSTRLDDMGLFGRKVGHGFTLHHALETFIRSVNSVSTHAKFWLEMETDGAWFCRGGIAEIRVSDQQPELYVLGLMTNIARLASTHDWTPEYIQLKTRRFEEDALRETFPNAEVQSGCTRTAIRISPEHLTAVAKSTSPSALCAQLLGELRALGPEALPALGEAAELIGSARRTLQRSLAEDGSSYRSICDRVRFEHATRMLVDSSCPLTEIALDTGYSDSANFLRSFRRWTGVTPMAYRRLRG